MIVVNLLFNILLRFVRKYVLNVCFIPFLMLVASGYCLYCFYINPKEIAYYCIDDKCVSIIRYYKGGGVNSVMYARVYDEVVTFRFQMKDNYAELLMEDDILISKEKHNGKIIIKGALPKTYGYLDNIEIIESIGYIVQVDDDYVLSRSLGFRNMF